MYKQHFLQSRAWAEVRKLQGWDFVEVGGNQYLLTKLLPLGMKMGYMPQVKLADVSATEVLQTARAQNLIYVHLDPHDLQNDLDVSEWSRGINLVKSDEVYYRHTAVLDLSKSEDELMTAMKPKTRYNVNLARKKGVSISISDSDEDLKVFLKLFFETVKRQNYFGRDEKYYQQIWESLKPQGKVRIALASYNNVPLVAWMLFLDNEVIYYPYGGSSEEYREMMPTYALVWGIVEWGKQNGYKYFDLWGTLGENPDEKSPEFGFHRFKVGFGGEQIEYLPAYDLVVRPFRYWLFQFVNKLRWMLLRIKKSLR